MTLAERVRRTREARHLRAAAERLVSIEGAKPGCDERGPYILPYVGGIGVRATEAPPHNTRPYDESRVAQLFQEIVAVDRAGDRAIANSDDWDEAILRAACRAIGRWEQGFAPSRFFDEPSISGEGKKLSSVLSY